MRSSMETVSASFASKPDQDSTGLGASVDEITTAQACAFLSPYNPLMPRSRKLDLEKIRAALNATRPHCNTTIPPEKQVRLDSST